MRYGTDEQIPPRRLRGYIGQINKKKMKEIDAALAISVGLRSLA